MEALKNNQIIENDGEIKLTGVPCKKGQQVEMIILIDSHEKPRREDSIKHFNAAKIRTASFKFDRELANER